MLINPHIGDSVERIAKDYTGGRTGKIIELYINPGTHRKSSGVLYPNRARVLWTREKSGSVMNLRTWVRFTDLRYPEQNPTQ